MKNKTIIFVILSALVLICIIICITDYFGNKRTYALRLPELENLGSISLEQNGNIKSITDTNEIKNILDVLNGTKRITKEESIQDSPVNTNKEIQINFDFKVSRVSIIFVYQKKNKYYIEQPYNGIYRISEDEYNLIEEYMR